MMSNRHCIAMVTAPTANTTSAPIALSARIEPGSAFRIGPVISVPPMPAAIEYSARVPSRSPARAVLAGRAPALTPRIEATR